MSTSAELRTAAGQPCLMEFDRSDPASVRWARRRAALLVTEVTNETRKAIRAIIARALDQGMAPRAAARLIRDVVGLRTDQTLAVANLQQQLQQAGQRATRTGRAVVVPYGSHQVRVPGRGVETRQSTVHVPAGGLPPDREAALLSRYAERLRRQRALLIARTETIAAANAGQQELWAQAVARRLLRGTELQRWVVSKDERLCPECRPLEGKTAPLGGVFQSGLGAVSGPPLHPNCRCTVVLSIPRRQ